MRRYLTTRALDELRHQLATRDEAVIRSVSELRYLSGHQLDRLHYGGEGEASARAARRALARLTRLDMLTRLERRVGGVRAGSAGFVYSLGLAGQAVAMKRGWLSPRRRRRAPSPGTPFLAHTLQVAELHVRLREAERTGRVELLALSAEPACWRRYGGIGAHAGFTLKPDSYVRLGVGEFEDSYFIEVDMGTEGSGAIRRKTSDYLGYYRSGQEQTEHGVFPKVVWAVPDEARAGYLAGVIARLPKDSRRLFDVVPFTALIDRLSAPEGGQNQS